MTVMAFPAPLREARLARSPNSEDLIASYLRLGAGEAVLARGAMVACRGRPN